MYVTLNTINGVDLIIRSWRTCKKTSHIYNTDIPHNWAAPSLSFSLIQLPHAINWRNWSAYIQHITVTQPLPSSATQSLKCLIQLGFWIQSLRNKTQDQPVETCLTNTPAMLGVPAPLPQPACLVGDTLAVGGVQPGQMGQGVVGG